MSVAGSHGRRRPAVPGLVTLIGAVVELRCIGGLTFRGELRDVSSDTLTIERATDGRSVLVSRSAVVAVVDELAPGLRTASRRDAADALEGEA